MGQLESQLATRLAENLLEKLGDKVAGALGPRPRMHVDAHHAGHDVEHLVVVLPGDIGHTLVVVVVVHVQAEIY